MIKMMDVWVARIYITESAHLLKTITLYLKNEAKIRGVSVFRAISGFGSSGEHSASLVDLSLDLPLVIEFFDVPNKIEIAVDHLNMLIKSGHIVVFPALVNHGES